MNAVVAIDPEALFDLDTSGEYAEILHARDSLLALSQTGVILTIFTPRSTGKDMLEMVLGMFDSLEIRMRGWNQSPRPSPKYETAKDFPYADYYITPRGFAPMRMQDELGMVLDWKAVMADFTNKFPTGTIF
jgi:hypothetical protein